MNFLDGFLKIEQNGQFVYKNWVEWDHALIPNEPEWIRMLIRGVMLMLGHCLECTVLDGCYFTLDNMPELPKHVRCHCNQIKIPYNQVMIKAKAKCNIKKFTEYVFKDDKASKGKKQIFQNLGYGIKDSEWLQSEFCAQALKNYLNGNYILRNLDMYGQRLAIIINLKNVTFYSGWMLKPNGLIENTTPFGGWSYEKV